MVTPNPIKVVKRAERQRPGQQAAGSASPEPSSRDRALAAKVREWVSEFEQARPARLQELRRQLGWQEVVGNGLPVHAAGDTVEGE